MLATSRFHLEISRLEILPQKLSWPYLGLHLEIFRLKILAGKLFSAYLARILGVILKFVAKLEISQKNFLEPILAISWALYWNL